MRRRLKILWMVLLGVVGLLGIISACRWWYTFLVPSYLFQEADCMEACWRGLRPAETSKDELLAFLDDGFEYETDTLTDGRIRLIARQELNWRKKIFLTIYLNDDTFSYFMVNGNFEFDLRVGEIITRFGEPEVIELDASLGPSLLSFASEWKLKIIMYYPQHGYSFYMPAKEKENGEICVDADTAITVFSVRPVSSLEEFIASESPRLPVDDVIARFQAWGDYECFAAISSAMK